MLMWSVGALMTKQRSLNPVLTLRGNPVRFMVSSAKMRGVATSAHCLELVFFAPHNSLGFGCIRV